ncbi:MAG: hypothetical protein B7Y99_08265 [Caulobacterales bacterium 32-69-10]|nr:MAG: hypothetical protein B7Y99_08265 [Caulobacterales bacterium 32-69-10]
MKRAAPLAMATLLALAAPAAQAQAPAAQAAEAAPEIQEVQKLADRWTAAYNAADRTALGALYTDDAKLYVHGSPTVTGRRGIETYWADDMKVDSPITVLRVTHAVDGIDMKLVHGDYQVLNRKTGVPLGHGRFAHIWARASGGQWLLDRDLWNQPYK